MPACLLLLPLPIPYRQAGPTRSIYASCPCPTFTPPHACLTFQHALPWNRFCLPDPMPPALLLAREQWITFYLTWIGWMDSGRVILSVCQPWPHGGFGVYLVCLVCGREEHGVLENTPACIVALYCPALWWGGFPNLLLPGYYSHSAGLLCATCLCCVGGWSIPSYLPLACHCALPSVCLPTPTPIASQPFPHRLPHALSSQPSLGLCAPTPDIPVTCLCSDYPCLPMPSAPFPRCPSVWVCSLIPLLLENDSGGGFQLQTTQHTTEYTQEQGEWEFIITPKQVEHMGGGLWWWVW